MFFNERTKIVFLWKETKKATANFTLRQPFFSDFSLIAKQCHIKLVLKAKSNVFF